MMPEKPCFICERQPAERDIARYRFSVCRACWDESWLGWAREHEARILQHLAQERLPIPTRNIAHLFPRA